MTGHRVTRRGALTGAAAVGVGLPVLAACGTDAPDGAPASDAPSQPATTGAAAAGAPLVAAADVPVGGGVVLTDQQVVVTQPAAGEFKAFSAVCTHQGCLVSAVADATITCTCHMSTFSVTDGAVTGGPAKTPLAPVAITVADGEISLT